MTTYNDIKGATELVEKYKADFETIDNSIAELEKRKLDLQGMLDNTIDKFKLESIEKNANNKHSLNLVNQYLKEAKQRKDELVREADKNLVDEAKQVILDHVESVKNNHNDINKMIAECLYEARILQQEMDKLNQEELQKINNLLNDLSPYFGDEAEFRKKTGGRNQAQYITHGLKKVFTQFPETAYYVRGLITRYSGAQEPGMFYKADYEQRFNKLIGVNINEVRASIETRRNIPMV